MRGGRWAWFMTGEDSQGRPLGVPDAHNPPPTTPDGVPDPAGGLVGLPVFSSEVVPSNLPSPGGTQDVLAAIRPSDLLLFEGEPRLSVFEQVLSGSMQARISMRNYAAFIPGRYPTGISVLSGSGLTVQVNE